MNAVRVKISLIRICSFIYTIIYDNCYGLPNWIRLLGGPTEIRIPQKQKVDYYTVILYDTILGISELGYIHFYCWIESPDRGTLL